MDVFGKNLFVLLCLLFKLQKQIYGQSTEMCSGNNTSTACKCFCDSVNCEERENWIPPNEWAGPPPAFYRSFDSSHDMVFYEHGSQSSNIPRTCGVLGYAWSMDLTREQWIDLGVVSDVCMVNPSTCTAGGAISLWLKVPDPRFVTNLGIYGGVLETYNSSTDVEAGITICQHHDSLVYFLKLSESGTLRRQVDDVPAGWCHVVLNYLGPSATQGIASYYNGVHEGTNTRVWQLETSPGDRIRVGKHVYVEHPHISEYGTFEIDELVIFNRALTQEEITMLAAVVTSEPGSNPCLSSSMWNNRNFYTCECHFRNCENSQLFMAPTGWTGHYPALYCSFDTLEGLTFNEGHGNSINALVTGMSGNAVNLNHTQKQWLDLGEHTEACMTRPGTCGANGGAISYWMNSIQPGKYFRAGVISGRKGGHTGFEVFVPWHRDDKLWYALSWPGGKFDGVEVSQPSDWTHVVFNFIGSNEGQGIKIYHDGVEVGSDTTKSPSYYKHHSPGKITVGRHTSNIDWGYCSVQMDEIAFFNQHLSQAEITLLSNSFT